MVDAQDLWITISHTFSVVPLAFGILATICILYLNPKNKNRLKFFAPVGEMTLTHYLMHSVLAIFIFYGVGLGLGGTIGPLIFIPLAIFIFVMQVIFSKIWLRFFTYGPLELVWKQFTYGKALPILRKYN